MVTYRLSVSMLLVQLQPAHNLEVFMCHRLYLSLLCLLLLCGLCMSSALAAGGDDDQQEEQLPPSVEDMSQEEFYTFVGLDPADEEQVQQFLFWLSDLNCGADYQDFCYSYMMAGYEQPGCAFAYSVYLSLHDFEPDLQSVTDNGYYTRYVGDDVALTYYKTADYGFPAGSWVLGTPGKDGTGGYFQTNIVNLTQLQNDVKNAVTQQDLTALESILNTINLNIVSGTYWNSQPITIRRYAINHSFLTSVTSDFRFAFQEGINAITATSNSMQQANEQHLDKWFNYLLSLSGSVNTFNRDGSISGTSYSGIQLFAHGMDAIARSVYNMQFRSEDYFDDFYKDQNWAYLFYSPQDGGGVSEDVSGTGLYALLGTGFSRTTLAITEGSRDNVNALLGKTEQTGQFYSYDDDGQLVSTTLSGSSIAAILLGSLSRLQADTAALHYVLADDDAVRLHTANKPLEDAIEDNFTGDKPAAPGVSDISDAAGITSGIQDALGDNPVSSSQFFQSVSSDDNYSFFSQQTQQALDTVGSSAADVAAAAIYGGRDDAWLDDYTFDENGFGTLKDDSFFSLSAFLGR